MTSDPSRRLSQRTETPRYAEPRVGAAIPMCAACEVREVTFCSALNEHELASIQAIVRQVRLAPGQTLFQEGDEAENVFNVVGGVIKLYKLLRDGRRQITGFLFPGDFLGIASRDGYSHSAEAVTAVRLCRFPRRRLEPLFDRYPKLEHRLLGIATDELTAAQDQMLLLGRKTAAEKLASFLLSLERRIGAAGEPAPSLSVPMSRSDVADYLGLTVETVSRTFGRFRKLGLVDVPDAHTVVLRRRQGLERIADGD